MRMIINENQGSLLRSIVRVGLVLVTAFGLRLDATQIGAIQMAAETLLQAAVQWDKRQ